jgi:hypothetical protein
MPRHTYAYMNRNILRVVGTQHGESAQNVYASPCACIHECARVFVLPSDFAVTDIHVHTCIHTCVFVFPISDLLLISHSYRYRRMSYLLSDANSAHRQNTRIHTNKFYSHVTKAVNHVIEGNAHAVHTVLRWHSLIPSFARVAGKSTHMRAESTSGCGCKVHAFVCAYIYVRMYDSVM